MFFLFMRSKPHVIQIGFNKTGTSSLGKLFKKNNYTVGSVKFAKIIQLNIINKVAPYKGLEHIDLFQDVENHKKGIYIYENFECLYNNYPKAYFILTTRSCESWIKSRMRHKRGNYARIALKNKNLNSLEELRDAWRNEFYDYHNLFEGDTLGGGKVMLVTKTEMKYKKDDEIYSFSVKPNAIQN